MGLAGQTIKLYILLYCESLSTASRQNCISNKFDVEKFYISICMQSQLGGIIIDIFILMKLK